MERGEHKEQQKRRKTSPATPAGRKMLKQLFYKKEIYIHIYVYRGRERERELLERKS